MFLSLLSILSQLERLKKEAAEVQKKVDETDIVMAEIETVSRQYQPLATSCSSIFFTIDSLQQVSASDFWLSCVLQLLVATAVQTVCIWLVFTTC